MIQVGFLVHSWDSCVAHGSGLSSLCDKPFPSHADVSTDGASLVIGLAHLTFFFSPFVVKEKVVLKIPIWAWLGGSADCSSILYSERLLGWSGHIPRLRVQSPVGVCMGGNRSAFLSLSHPLSLKSVNISSGED